jgi:MFS transporter, Spinster family, sphingosine-1-phosphate transporter
MSLMMNTSHSLASRDEGFHVSAGQAWYTLILMMLLMVFGLMDRMIIGTLFPQLKAEWGLTDAKLGVLASAVSWSMAGFVIPAALLADRWSRKHAITLMALVWTVATIACGMAGNFTQLFVARLLIGAGEGGFNAGAVSMIATIFPPRLRATVISLFSSSGAFGTVIGVVLGGFIATRWGWREAFFMVAAPGLLVALLFAVGARDYKTYDLQVSSADGGPARAMRFRELLQALFTTPSLVCLYGGIAATLFFQVVIVAWSPSLFARTESLPMDKASVRAAALMLAAATGIVLAGLLTDQLKKRSPTAIMLGPAAFSLISGVLLALALHSFEGASRLVLMICGSLFMLGSVGPAFAAAQTVVHPGLRATTVGVINVIGHLTASIGPIFAGAMSDRLGIATGIELSTLALGAAAIFFVVGARYYEADAARFAHLQIPPPA